MIADIRTKELYGKQFEKLGDMAGVKGLCLIESEKEC